MVQPYNYAIQAPSAFESLVSGLKLGTSLQEMQAQREQRALQAQAMQQKMEAERQRQEVLRDFYGKAKAEQPLTVADWLRFGEASGSAEYRNLASAQIKAMPEAQQQANAGFMGQTMVALYKSPEIGLQLLRDRVAANPQDKGLQAILQTAETNTKAAAVGMYGMMSGLGGKFADVAKNVADTLGMKEEAPLSPEAQREAVAKADKAVADAISAQATATTAQERAAADLRRAQAEAQKAEVQARVQAAEEKVAGGIELTPELRTAIGSTKLPADQRRALLDLAAAKAPKTAVTIQGEAEAGAFGKSLVARFDKIREQADLSTSQLANLDVAQKILDDGFKTGFGAEWKTAAASVLSSLGVKDATKFATNAQLFLAQSRSALLTKQLEQKGPQTENDAKRIDQTFASLGNTLEANKFLIAHARAMALRNRELVTFWQKYRRENRTFDGAQEAYEEGPGAKSIFDYAPLKPFASVVPESVWSTAPMPTITPPATQAAPVTPATAPRGPRPSLNDIFR